jgi:ribosomal-protein-alanine N-acetyltransferase
MRYWSSPPWTSVAKAHELIDRDRAEMQAGKLLTLGIELHGTAQIIGTCTLFSFMHQCKRAETGYGLSHPFWGKGYMHEALNALLAHGFKELGLNRVEADVDPRNVASTKCLERLGFLQEGHLRERWIVGDEVSDSILYGLLRRDWQARINP